MFAVLVASTSLFSTNLRFMVLISLSVSQLFCYSFKIRHSKKIEHCENSQYFINFLNFPSLNCMSLRKLCSHTNMSLHAFTFNETYFTGCVSITDWLQQQSTLGSLEHLDISTISSYTQFTCIKLP